jgi:RNA polymerase sigma factor (sigma-70 family)
VKNFVTGSCFSGTYSYPIMNTPKSMPSLEVTSDAELVAACLAGDREAFGRIVERYQRLLCSLAYSATGQLSESEDLAQDAFVDAWRQLGALREPEKLRSWLCGILRHKVGRLRRADGREPVRRAGTLEDAGELASAEQPAGDHAIEKEEQAIMWSALERVPELYREPLVLYYREHRSVEHVADALDLTEDAVKQRLARGRKILQEQVLAFVEGALVRSTPGRIFTLAVLAALPEFVTPAKAAGLGAAAAHGGMLMKSTGIATLLSSVSGVVSAALTLRANLDQSRTPKERRAVVKLTLAVFSIAMGFLVAWYLLRAAAFRWWENRVIFASIAQALVLIASVAWPVMILRGMGRMRVLRSAERKAHPELFQDARDQVGSSEGEYKSRLKLFGVPLVHARFSSPDDGEKPVFGWFASGDRAYGLVCAWGGLAVAPISIGAISVGFISAGSFSAGVISLGTVVIGIFGVGCATISVKAYAWLSALGWQTAQSAGFAISRVAAEGPVALAPHANDPVARAMLADPQGAEHQMIILVVLSLLSIIPVAYYARAVRQRLGARRKTP